MKKLVKYPPKRQPISNNPKNTKDWAFTKKLKKMDKEYEEKLKYAEKGVIDRYEKDPQILLAKQMREMLNEEEEEEEEDQQINEKNNEENEEN